jgi:hypothetical protein
MFKKLEAFANKIDPELTKKAMDTIQNQMNGGGSKPSTPPTSSTPAPVASHQPVPSGNGKKRALLVGINYFGTKAELRGCLNDVKNVHQLITSRFGYQDIRILTDDPQNQNKPTKRNILDGFRWLLSDVKPGDSLFLHYSGHGAYQADSHGDEHDGQDETICPVDYETAGMITDDDMHDLLVNPLPKGAKLTCIFDCCHSGTMLDLPFTYQPDQNGDQILKRDNTKEALKAGFKAFQALQKGDAMGALKEAMRAVNLIKDNSSGAPPTPAHTPKRETLEAKMSKGEVLMFSGCMDHQTSADAHIEGQMTGAMSWGILKVLEKSSDITLSNLLRELRGLLHGHYKQVPQMSTGYEMDVNNTKFSLVQ